MAIDYTQMDEVCRGIEIIVRAINVAEEDIIEAFEEAETLFDRDELEYIRGEFKQRYL